MKIEIIPTLSDNNSFIIHDGNNAVLIDCGEAKPVLEFLERENLFVSAMLCTHHHYDHIDGISDLKNAYPELRVYAPEKDLVRIPAQYGLHDQDKLTLNGIEFQCIETPGHTKNHLCFYAPDLNAVFTGDTLFSLGCGRLLEGTPEEMFHSLQKLKTLPDNTAIYCGHEYTVKNCEFALSVEPENKTLREKLQKLRAADRPMMPVSMKEEKETNPFLRIDTDRKFAELRKLRDQF